MNEVMTCLVRVIRFVEVRLHVVHAMQGVICGGDEAMVEWTKMGEADTKAALEEGVPIRFVGNVVESEACGFLK